MRLWFLPSCLPWSLPQTFFVESICVDPEVIAANIVVSGVVCLTLWGTGMHPRQPVTVRSLCKLGCGLGQP